MKKLPILFLFSLLLFACNPEEDVQASDEPCPNTALGTCPSLGSAPVISNPLIEERSDSITYVYSFNYEDADCDATPTWVITETNLDVPPNCYTWSPLNNKCAGLKGPAGMDNAGALYPEASGKWFKFVLRDECGNESNELTIAIP